jgi:hypothetical protein
VVFGPSWFTQVVDRGSRKIGHNGRGRCSTATQQESEAAPISLEERLTIRDFEELSPKNALPNAQRAAATCTRFPDQSNGGGRVERDNDAL